MNQVLLLILDGWGEYRDYSGNAIRRAATPNIDRLRKNFPWTLLKTDGQSVGLPKGFTGGSEVGHLTMGAGRTVWQFLEMINRSIQSGAFFQKPELLRLAAQVRKEGSALHLLGMISDAGVHSHIDHLFALLKFAKQQKIKKVYIHAILDGRDVPERSAKKYLDMIQKEIKRLGIGKIASVVGRFYAMDRDKNYDRTKVAFELLTKGKGIKESDPISAIEHAYGRGVKTDYYMEPILLDEEGVIKKGDSVIFFNYRTDRARQLTEMFAKTSRLNLPWRFNLVCFGPYTEKFPVLFPLAPVKHNLANWLAKFGKTELRMAETEKYAHVTYFFNSQIEKPVKGEKRILVPSSKVKSYAEKPEMSAREITEKLLAKIKRSRFDFIAVNFANGDLVGHSGDFRAAKKAIETLDECIGRIVEAALAHGFHTIITADHGNAEYMIYDKNWKRITSGDAKNSIGKPCPSHTKNPVPFLLVSDSYKNVRLRKNASLKDIAPTILKLMKLPKPKEMTGENLF